MTKYIMKDVITNPEDPRLKDAIGKRVYCGNEVSKLLKNANSNYCVETLTQIEDVDFEPFTTKDEYGDPSDWNCIIIVKKDEQKPKYVPFEDGREFLKSYTIVESCLISENFFLSHHGIWLKDCENDDCFLVTEIWDDGVVWGSNQKTTHWDELLKDFTFLDGSPCGRKEDFE